MSFQVPWVKVLFFKDSLYISITVEASLNGLTTDVSIEVLVPPKKSFNVCVLNIVLLINIIQSFENRIYPY